MKRAQAVIVISTFSDEKSAIKVGRKMLDARLCACLNIAMVRSLYLWEGRQEDQNECLAIFKTVPRLSSRLKQAIAADHPYKVPEIVEIAVDGVSAPYLAWLAGETSTKRVSKKRNNSAK